MKNYFDNLKLDYDQWNEVATLSDDNEIIGVCEHGETAIEKSAWHNDQEIIFTQEKADELADMLYSFYNEQRNWYNENANDKTFTI